MIPDDLLQLTDVSVDYGNARALFGVSLSVPAGTALAVLGSNGAGKSTLAKAVSGSVEVSGGSIRFDGNDITDEPAYKIARAGLAHVPEGRGIFPGLSVEDNLRMSLRRVTGISTAEAIERAYAFFPVLGVRRKQRAGTLSGGEQQMLALARILASPPRLAIADELSLGLAPLLIEEIFQALEKARAEGVTLVIIEQFVDRALAFADQAVIMRQGRISWSGPADAAGDAVLAEYLGEAEPTH